MASKKQIKGITIEINGDATKLDKALNTADKSIKDTQSSLKDLDKYLKLDPKNVELLTQKQQLLQKSTDQLSDKYNTLQQALEGATPDDALYQRWINSQAQIQSQLNKTEQEAEELRKTLATTDDLGFDKSGKEWASYQKDLEKTEQAAEDLRKRMADTYEELGRPISVEGYQQLQRELVGTEASLKDATKAMEDFSVEGAQADADSAKFADSLNGISGKAKAAADALAPVSTAAAALGAAIFATIPATDEYRTKMSMLEESANRAGVSMEDIDGHMKTLMAVSGDSSAAIEALSNLLQAGFTGNALGQAVDEIAGAVEAFPDTLKIESLADSLQETIATGEATGQYVELLDRLGASTEVFNNNMEISLDLEDRQTYALQELTRNGLGEAHRAWEENNQDMVANAAASYEFQKASAQLAEVVLPIMTTVTNALASLIQWFTELPTAAQGGILGLVGGVALLAPVAQTIASITSVMGAFTAASGAAAVGAGAFALTIGKWVLIIGAVVAAVWLLVEALQALFGAKKDVDSVDGGGVDLNLPGPTTGGGRTYNVRGYATGGVFEPNNPMLGVLGDNPREREVAAPESMLQGMVDQAVARAGAGGGQRTVVNVKFTGDLAQVGRILKPVITTETNRLGPDLIPD